MVSKLQTARELTTDFPDTMGERMMIRGLGYCQQSLPLTPAPDGQPVTTHNATFLSEIPCRLIKQRDPALQTTLTFHVYRQISQANLPLKAKLIFKGTGSSARVL
jgi:hypothetical protein